MTPLTTSLVGGALGASIGLICGCPDRTFKYGIVGLLAGNLVGKLAAKGTTVAGAQMNIEEVRPGVRLGRAFWTNEEVQSPDWPNQFANFMSAMFSDAPARKSASRNTQAEEYQSYLRGMLTPGVPPCSADCEHCPPGLHVDHRCRCVRSPGPMATLEDEQLGAYGCMHCDEIEANRRREPMHVMDQYGGEFATGFQCPEGFDLVSSDHQIACAYRGQSACLAGTTDASGQFICTQRDFECPPGMLTRRGSPSNWCFPA